MVSKDYSFYTTKFNLLISSMHALYRLSCLSLSLEELMKRLVRLIAQVLEAPYCSISIFDETKEFNQIKVMFKGNQFTISKKTRILKKDELSIFKKGDSIFKNHYMICPLISEDINGLIILKRSGKFPVSFNAIDRQILSTFSEQVMVALRNAILHEDHHKLILGSIKSLVDVLNIKSEHIYKHTKFFPKIVMAIAHKMGLNEREMQSLYYASLLHDAGKAEIPLKILAKRRKLSGKEFKIIKTHPEKGLQFLKHLDDLKPALPIILHHHERYDGKGYPSKLKKHQIPVGARIMALADAFEATVLGRPYKERISIKNAVEEIKRHSGTQFDPEVIEAFLKVIRMKDLLTLIRKIRG